MDTLLWISLWLTAASLARCDEPRPADPLRVVLEPCAPAARPRTLADFLGLSPADSFTPVRRGTLRVDDRSYALFLPAGPYAITDLAPGGTARDNTATRIGVDHDGDGRIANHEQRPANLPLRIGDRMFDVTAIEPDGSALTLTPTTAPLMGIVVDRACPPFAWTTQDGKPTSLADHRGKILILDIWSYT